MPKLYFSYISSNFILPFGVSTIFFVLFLLTFELFKILSVMSSDDISIFFILGLVKDVMVTLIPMAIPISIFFSTIFCLNRMSGDSEYIALRAAGLQKNKILVPFLLIGMGVSISLYFFGQEFVPQAHTQVRQKIKVISSTSLIQGIKSGQFFTRIGNITLFTSDVNETTKELKGIFLHIFDPDTSSEKIINATEGRILHEKDAKTGLESFKLLLKSGNIVNRDNSSNDMEKILFDEYMLPISEKRFDYSASMKEIMMNFNELNHFINGGEKQAVKNGFSKRDYRNAKYEFWNRINTPLLCLLLTFVGFGLGVTGTRGRGKNSSGKAILVLIGYYALYFAFVGAARDGVIPSILAVILPAIVLFVFGLRTYRRLDWIN